MSLAGIAAANRDIIDRGRYRAPAGHTVELDHLVSRALEGSRLYRPRELDDLLGGRGEAARPLAEDVVIEVSEEKTGEAARRVAAEHDVSPLALNFASAKSPGGGYVRGARAQEEDLARCSALYDTLLRHREYYDVNRAHRSLLYTDHMIYSPEVPFFRDERYDLLDEPVTVGVITAPAPNAGEVLRRQPRAESKIEEVLRRRAGMVLALAEAEGHRHLVLGAWGCGVFRNQPALVADAFGHWLESPRFAGAFEYVLFAVYERGKRRLNQGAFYERFS